MSAEEGNLETERRQPGVWDSDSDTSSQHHLLPLITDPSVCFDPHESPDQTPNSTDLVCDSGGCGARFSMSHDLSRQSCSLRLKMLYGDYKYLLAFILIVLATFFICTRNAHIIVASLQYLEQLEPLRRMLMFVALFFMVSLPFAWGYIILNVGAGFLYGFWAGLCLVCLCSSIGISATHFLNRYCLKTYLQRIVSRHERLSSMLRLLDGKHAFKLIALSRLTPFPFGLMNALFAVSDVTYLDYVTASVLGLLPTQALNAYVGTTLRSIEEVTSHHASYYVTLVVQLLISGLLSTLVIRLAKENLEAELRNASNKSEPSYSRTMADIV